MAYKDLNVVIEGVAPLMMHSAQLADASNKWTKAIKAITAKGKKKTEADMLEVQRLEFLGSLYVNADMRPIVPGENIEGMIRDGARKSRAGKDAQCGVFCMEPGVLEYDGPKTAENLWADERFRDARTVVVNKARIVRTRPKFPVGWMLTFALQFDDGIVSQASIEKWLEDAGDYVGLLEYRPRFGRFRVVTIV